MRAGVGPASSQWLVAATDCFSFLEKSTKAIEEEKDGQFSFLFLAVRFLFFESE